MTTPRALYLDCPTCQDETLHKIVKARVSGKKKKVMDALVRCNECKSKYAMSLQVSVPVEIPVVISWLEKSERTMLEADPDSELVVGDEIFLGEQRVKITAIESGGKRVNTALAREIETIWSVRYEKVRVKISISKRDKTVSKEILAVPEEEFYVNDMLTVDKMNVVIHRIKTEDGVLRTGMAHAKDIKRVYGRIVR